jgi:hypothetical protein
MGDEKNNKKQQSTETVVTMTTKDELAQQEIGVEAKNVAKQLMESWGSDLHHAIAVLDAAKVIVIDAARDLLRREEEKTRQLRMAVECVNTGTPRDRRAGRLADDTAILDYFKREPIQAVGSAYIAEQTGIAADDLRKALQRLTKAGKLTCTGRGMGAKYALATTHVSIGEETAAE